jgi:tetratricopeptide (TPR) repeat protein
MDRDFKTAVRQLEKACLVDSNSTNALWMLGYSYFHTGNFKRSVTAYSRVIAIDKTNREAYYFRAIARINMAKDALLANAEREKCIFGAINDLNKAILIKPEDSYYQNRGLAYREYASLKMRPSGPYDKAAVAIALKAAIADFERLLNSNPGRTDIASLLDVSKEKLATVVGHH